MTDRSEKIFVFVKGKKGKYAYLITSADFEKIHSHLEPNLRDKNGDTLWPPQTDREAIIHSLEYIRDNRSKNIPENPIIHLYTTYENNFHVAVGMEKAKKTIAFKNAIDDLMEGFRTDEASVHDRVKIQWIPKGFESQMEELENMLDNLQAQEQPSKKSS